MFYSALAHSPLTGLGMVDAGAVGEVRARQYGLDVDIPLRIMPLGASITYGQGSSDGNGYRNWLRSNLTEAGNIVNMVGNQKNGNMRDNDNEGWPGYIVAGVHSRANVSVSVWKPNVVLVNAGTNDCGYNIDIPNAGNRMHAMLTDVWNASPDATVVLSTLLVNANATTQKYIENVNKQYTSLAASLRQSGQKIVLADMHGLDGPQLSDLVDGTHPNDYGYSKMASIWYQALQNAAAAGFISAAENIGIPDDGDA